MASELGSHFFSQQVHFLLCRFQIFKGIHKLKTIKLKSDETKCHQNNIFYITFIILFFQLQESDKPEAIYTELHTLSPEYQQFGNYRYVDGQW